RHAQSHTHPPPAAIEGRKSEVIDANAGKACLFALRVFIGAEEKRLVLLDGAADRETGLHTRVRLLHGFEDARVRINLSGKCVTRLKRFVAKIAERVSVKF